MYLLISQKKGVEYLVKYVRKFPLNAEAYLKVSPAIKVSATSKALAKGFS